MPGAMDVEGFAVVTGAASGIGRACALEFAREGAKGLALLDLNSKGLAELESTLKAQHGESLQVLVREVNVTDEGRVDTAMDFIAHSFGRIDYLVHAAGLAIMTGVPISSGKTADWNKSLDVNLKGTFFCNRAAMRIMLKQDPGPSKIPGRPAQRGSVVNIASISGLTGQETAFAYCAAKHGVIGLTRSASEACASQGIRVNAICPGYIDTPMTRQTPELIQQMKNLTSTATAIKRVGMPEEIADAALYLSGGRSSYVTGTTIIVDGGYTTR